MDIASLHEEKYQIKKKPSHYQEGKRWVPGKNETYIWIKSANSQTINRTIYQKKKKKPAVYLSNEQTEASSQSQEVVRKTEWLLLSVVAYQSRAQGHLGSMHGHNRHCWPFKGAGSSPGLWNLRRESSLLDSGDVFLYDSNDDYTS